METEAVRVGRIGSRIVRYITARQNDDGGYTSVQYTDSTLYDTYLAIEVLSMLGVKPPCVEETISWVKNYDAVNIRDYYLINKIFSVLKQPLIDVSEHVIELMDSTGRFGAEEVDVETTSELETTFMCVELMNMFKPVHDERILGFVLSLKNLDGGFGALESGLSSTFYAQDTFNA